MDCKHQDVNQQDNPAQLMEAYTHIWKYVFSSVQSQTLRCAVQLGIPDMIHSHGKPMPLSTLVAALSLPPTKTDYVNRLMRFLIHAGFFLKQKLDNQSDEEQEEEGFVLTPSSRLLLKDCPNTMSTIVLAIVDPIFMTPLHFLSTCFDERCEYSTPFEAAHGTTIWELWEKQQPEHGKKFAQAMANDSSMVMSIIFKERKKVFDDLKSLVDVGGGIGSASKAISQAFPHIKCLVLDLPNVVTDLPKLNNVDFLGGDMFEAIPPADSVFMKFIMHDWKDEDCIKILKNCRKAIPSREEGGKVIIVDVVMEREKKRENLNQIEIETQLVFDIIMMAMVNGKERTEKEWKQLFSESGFRDYKITPLSGVHSLIEVYP